MCPVQAGGRAIVAEAGPQTPGALMSMLPLMHSAGSRHTRSLNWKCASPQTAEAQILKAAQSAVFLARHEWILS